MLATINWYSIYWLKWSTLTQLSWENPWAINLLYALPLLLFLRWIINFRSQRLTVALQEEEVKSSIWSWLRFIPLLFLISALSFFILGLARPQVTNEKVEQWTEGIDIMLVIDISESMQITDFKPNRLEAAKKTAREFIAGRFQDRIGIVIFSGDAYSLSPLTTDYDLLNTYIEDINFNKITKGGTAIGSAIAVGTNRMMESETKSKVMILLSDGENTAGNIDPITAANLAHAYGIKIYSIAVGREGKVPFKRRMVNNTLDETALREIARIGEGEFFRVSNNKALAEVFSLIDKYEKAEIKETRYRETTDYYYVYLYWGISFLLCWILLKSTFLSNLLED